MVFQGGEDNHDIFNATNLNLNGGPSFWDIVGQFSKGALVPVIVSVNRRCSVLSAFVC